MAKQRYEVVRPWAGVSLGDVIDLDPEKIHPAIKSNIRKVVKAAKATGNAAEVEKLLTEAEAKLKSTIAEADKVLADAKAEAEQIVKDARAEADSIMLNAHAEAEALKAKK